MVHSSSSNRPKEGGEQGLGIRAIPHCWQLLEIIPFVNHPYTETLNGHFGGLCFMGERN